MKPGIVRIAVLASFNLDLLRRPLADSLSRAGLSAELYFSGYGLWEVESADQNSSLHEFKPAVVIVFADSADLLSPLSQGDILQRSSDAAITGAAAWQRLQTAIDGVRRSSPQATVFVHNIARPRMNALGTLVDNAGYGSDPAIATINNGLRMLAAESNLIRVVDYAGFLLEHGYASVADQRLWHLGRMRIGRKGLELLASLYTRYISAALLPRRKCLVLDLDNTLWGGVIGEDGVQGIAIGQEGIGLAFREFQLAIKAIAQRGVILAIASKNNPADVFEVLDNHPEMVLRRQDFACIEVHWNPKSESLARIAKQLNIGLDSLVFWDDEPREREIIRDQTPLVLIPEVPSDPSAYAEALFNLECFDVLNLTEEDRRRGEMYRQDISRQQLLGQYAAGEFGGVL